MNEFVAGRFRIILKTATKHVAPLYGSLADGGSIPPASTI